MNENWKFSDIPYTRPDVEALQARYDALTRRAREARSPEELVEIVRQRDALQQEVGLCQAVAFIRAFHDVTDEFYQTELQETLPRLEGSLDSQSLAAAIAESPYAPALDRAFGPQLRRLLTLDHRIHAGGRDLQARISQLTALYQQLTASAKYPVHGELLSGGQLRAALASRDRARRKAAYDAQQQTVLENVCFPLEIRGIPRKERREKALELLGKVGLADKANAYPAQLSGGQKQRVAIARVLANEPEVILCDEATSALDPETTQTILKLLKSIRDTLGITIVVITHEMRVIQQVCTRVAVLDGGLVQEEGRVADIFAHPASRAAKRLLLIEDEEEEGYAG